MALLYPIAIFSRVFTATPALETRALTPPVCTDCGSNTCQLVTSAVPLLNSGMRCAGTRSLVRYRLASPRAGSSSCSRLLIVTLGHTTSTVSENQLSPLALTLLRMLHAASMPMTVVFPAPVAILHAS